MKDFDQSKHFIVYNLEQILLNLYFGLKLHLKNYRNNNNCVIQNDLFNELDDQIKFDALFFWLADSFDMYKSTFAEKTKKLNLMEKTHDLNINRRLFLNFPEKTECFFFSQADSFLVTSPIDDDLYLYRVCPSYSSNKIKKNSFFSNFIKQYSLKELNNGVLNESSKLEGIFLNPPSRSRLDIIKSKSSKLNDQYPDNLDFVLFCFKCLDYFSQETCYYCWTLWLKEMLNNEDKKNPILKGSSRIEYNFKNKLSNLDILISQRTFAYLLFFSNQNIYIEPNHSINIEWKNIFMIKDFTQRPQTDPTLYSQNKDMIEDL